MLNNTCKRDLNHSVTCKGNPMSNIKAYHYFRLRLQFFIFSLEGEVVVVQSFVVLHISRDEGKSGDLSSGFCIVNKILFTCDYSCNRPKSPT